MFWHTLVFLLWKIIGMKNKTILLLAVGDGAINIVEQNKEKFPDVVEIVSIRVVQGMLMTWMHQSIGRRCCNLLFQMKLWLLAY